MTTESNKGQSRTVKKTNESTDPLCPECGGYIDVKHKHTETKD
jgi:DNA-directed RNA polymerase subunit RPC12/RpoP